ncbi:MAG: sigma-70 family RNA polymerase sigma factor, partial [Phycisphaerales bacterium]|nr:sigma-70 family RNA polymerase sigma factor [Phycisphaerales bacterium]
LRLAARQRQQQHPLPQSLGAVDDAALERLELTHQVHDALEELGGRCRDLLLALVRADKTPYTAIAQELEMPVGSIGPTRARCLARLLGLLRSRGVQP